MLILEQEYFSPREVADLLKVDEQTVLRWLRAGKLGGYKVGRKLWRIREVDITQFLTKNAPPSQKEEA